MRYISISVLLFLIFIISCCSGGKSIITKKNVPPDSLFIRINNAIKEQTDPYLYRKFKTVEGYSYILDQTDRLRYKVIKDIGIDYLKSDTIIFIESNNLFDYYCCVYTSFDKKTIGYQFYANSRSDSLMKEQIEKTAAIKAVLSGSVNEYIKEKSNKRTTPPLTVIISVFSRVYGEEYDFYNKKITTQ